MNGREMDCSAVRYFDHHGPGLWWFIRKRGDFYAAGDGLWTPHVARRVLFSNKASAESYVRLYHGEDALDRYLIESERTAQGIPP